MAGSTGSQVRVPFADPARATSRLRAELQKAITEVLESGRLILGPRVEAFEDAFASWVGTSHAVGVASGTDALELALRAVDAGGGDVVTQANTCVPTVAAIERAGCTPVLCDVLGPSGAIDPDALAESVSPTTSAIVPVHLYGQCADMDAVMEIANERGIPVVEDCAQAHGARWGDRPAGTFGALGCFSFYPTKNLGALGDAGAVVTDDAAMAQRLRRLREYGCAGGDHHVERGVNSRLDELQAAVLQVKLPHLAGWNARRAQIAAVYDSALENGEVQPLERTATGQHAFHLYVVRVGDRASFRRALATMGIETLVHYGRPIHHHKPYAQLVRGGISLGRSEELAAEVVSIPLYPELEDWEIERVACALREATRAA
jgi:dTDP-4-amino-4,6-dideoxygalactose transaminase